MTIEDFKKKITFSEIREGDQVEIVGSIRLSQSVRVSDQELRLHPEAENYVHDKIMWGLLRSLYQDNRRALCIAIREFQKCDPMDFQSQHTKMDAIYKAAGFQPPNGIRIMESEHDETRH